MAIPHPIHGDAAKQLLPGVRDQESREQAQASSTPSPGNNVAAGWMFGRQYQMPRLPRQYQPPPPNKNTTTKTIRIVSIISTLIF